MQLVVVMAVRETVRKSEGLLDFVGKRPGITGKRQINLVVIGKITIFAASNQ
jgi:hypothetical protein